MKNITFKKLTPSEIPSLVDAQMLHMIDFRATGEAFTYDIDSMWRYENWINHLPLNGYALVNEESEDKTDKKIIVPKGEKSHISLAARFMKQTDTHEFSGIFAHVAHPEIDTLGTKLGLPVSYTYPDYLKLNSKILQKELLGQLTPAWQKVEKGTLWTDAFPVIKRTDGSGGYGVFIKGVQSQEDLINAYSEFTESEWFAESFIDGIPMSVQIYKNENEYTVFGYSEMLIENKRNFVGAQLKSIETVDSKYPWLASNITDAVTLLDPLISSYCGFMGIDFMLQTGEKTISVLEANIRMTSVSIPMLISNEKGKEGILYEGYEKEVGSEDVILAQSGGESDVVKF